MGEYIRYKGEEVKIGTCEQMYYTSFDNFIKHLPDMKQQSGNLSPEAYLQESNFWRLPFPDEKNLPFGNINGDFDRCLSLYIARDNYEALKMTGHKTFYLPVMPAKFTGHGFNISIPCPYSEDFKNIKTSTNTDKGFFISSRYQYGLLNLIYQKNEDGKLLPVVQCPYCKSLWTLDTKQDLVNLIKGNRKTQGNVNNEMFLKLIKDFKRA